MMKIKKIFSKIIKKNHCGMRRDGIVSGAAELINTGNKYEPRVCVYLSCDVESKVLLIKDFKKNTVPNKSFTSLAIIKNQVGYLKHNPQAVRFFHDNSFIGFREKTQFFLLCNGDFSFFNESDFLSQSIFKSGIFEAFRNIFVYDPTDSVSLSVRYSNPVSRLNVIIEDGNNDVEWVFKNYESIDTLIVSEVDFSKFKTLALRKIIIYRDSEDIERCIKSAILDNSDKEVNLLLHVYGSYELLDDIDSLNAGNIEVVVKLNSDVSKTSLFCHKAFEDNLECILQYIDYILVRESILLRYQYLFSSNEILQFLKYSCKDGIRYAFI